MFLSAGTTGQAASVSEQTPTQARWGSAPIPLNITGWTGDELSEIHKVKIKIIGLSDIKQFCL